MIRPTQIKICLLEPCNIIKLGVEACLKRLNTYRVQLIEISLHGSWPEQLINTQPDILIINPCVLGLTYPFLEKLPQTKSLALITNSMDTSLLKGYDGCIKLKDSIDQIKIEIDRVLSTIGDEEDENTSEQQSLTPREKQIVICVVKGQTNKEIADTLGLSTHTVITHRRNIAKKLQVHSPSGLTIYAIVNKLVELGEVAH